MTKADLIVGLDIGTTKICAVVGTRGENGSIDIVGIGQSNSTGMRKGMIVNIDLTVKSIQEAVRQAELMADCEINSVYVGIAGSHITGINSRGMVAVKGGEVDQRDIERAIDGARTVAIPSDREVVHILPQEYILDNQRGIINPLGMSGVRLEVNVHIVTGSASSVQNIAKSCQKSKLDVAGIALESLASAKAVLTEEEQEIGVALVDIGGGTTDIAIFTNESIKYTSVVPYGGHDITKDIASVLSTPLAAAEKIKQTYGSVLTDSSHGLDKEEFEVPSVGGRPPTPAKRQLLAQICEARMAEILKLADKSITESGYKGMLGAGIILTGGTSLISGCQDLACQIFGKQTRIGLPRDIGGLPVNNPMYATAVGLLRYGIEKESKSGGSGLGKQGLTFAGRFWSTLKNWFTDVS